MENIQKIEELAKTLANLTSEVTFAQAKKAEIKTAIETIETTEPMEPPYIRYYYTEKKTRSFVDIRSTPNEMILSLKTRLTELESHTERMIEKIDEIINQLKTIGK